MSDAVNNLGFSKGREMMSESFAVDFPSHDRSPSTAVVHGNSTSQNTAIPEQKASTIDLPTIEPQTEALSALPPREIACRQIFPYAIVSGRLIIAVGSELSDEAFDEVRLIAARPIRTVRARPEDIRDKIKECFGLGGGTLDQIATRETTNAPTGSEEDLELANEASVMRLVNELVEDAFRHHASDIHLEPTLAGLDIRYRIDGLLQPELTPPEMDRFRYAIISRVKIMAKLNIAERRLPQDGRFRIKIDNRERDVRVSIIPMLYGEGVVLRLLDPHRAAFQLEKLHFPDSLASDFGRLIRSSHGIILVTGPTGSGKTTTLCSALLTLKGTHTKIVTIEDPIEYELDGISQIQVQSKIGLTFAGGLRSVLRHDPDVILVGEIRDVETARSAIQAAMTGHLVFSTLHTNDAPSAYTRLIDMGIEPYLAAGAVIGVLAQRLVRRLCTECRIAYSPNLSELPVGFPTSCPEVLYRPGGCRECRMTGYSGRIALFEFVKSTTSLRKACLSDKRLSGIYRSASSSGYRPLRHDGWEKVCQGLTDIDEVMRVTGLDADVLSDELGDE